jgi:hypothetical protein
MNGSKGTITKRKKLFDKYKDFEPAIQFFPDAVLYENALKRYRHLVHYTYGPLISNIDNPSEQELNILAVDYLFQFSSNLSQVFHQTHRKVGNSILIDRLAIKTYLLIRKNYPFLAEECVHQIYEIRNSYNLPKFIKPSTLNNSLFRSNLDLLSLEYNSEPTDTIFYNRSEQGIMIKKHGVIVEALKNELTCRGIYPFNSRNRDLFTIIDGTINIAFEIKTEKLTQDIATGIGQLLWYYVDEKRLPKKILVLPERLHPDDERRLAKLNIYPLYYFYKKRKPEFIDIDKILISEEG